MVWIEDISKNGDGENIYEYGHRYGYDRDWDIEREFWFQSLLDIKWKYNFMLCLYSKLK